MESTQANEAHNDFLQMLAELGIIIDEEIYQ